MQAIKVTVQSTEVDKAVALVNTYKQQMADLTTIIGHERKRILQRYLVNGGGAMTKARRIRIAEYEEQV